MDFDNSRLGQSLNFYQPYLEDSENNSIKSLLGPTYILLSNNIVNHPNYSQAIRSYVDEPIHNEYLRGELKINMYNNKLITEIALLIEAINISPPISQDIYTFRGIDSRFFPSSITDLNIGDRLQNNGFTSMSLDYFVGEEFAGRCCIFMIKVPKGTQALYIDYEEQSELILKPNITLTIIDIFERSNSDTLNSMITVKMYVCEIIHI